MLEKQFNKESLSNLLQQGNYDPTTANILATLAQSDPKSVPKLLELLGQGGYGQAAGIPEGEIAPQSPQSFAGAIAQGARGKQVEKEKKRTPAELKHEDALVSAKQNLEAIVNTTDRMLNRLNRNDVYTGLLPSKIEQYSPDILGRYFSTDTEAFGKDAAGFINLTSQDIKGVPSRYRVQLIEKEKPGLSHSIPVNRDILQRKKKEAQEKLKDLEIRYPDIFEKLRREPESQQPSSQFFDELPDPAKYKGKRFRDKDTGIILKSNGIEWLPDKGNK
jgi:hypothetical protein